MWDSLRSATASTAAPHPASSRKEARRGEESELPVGEAGVGIIAPMVAGGTAAGSRADRVVGNAFAPAGAVAPYSAIVPDTNDIGGLRTAARGVDDGDPLRARTERGGERCRSCDDGEILAHSSHSLKSRPRLLLREPIPITRL